MRLRFSLDLKHFFELWAGGLGGGLWTSSVELNTKLELSVINC